MNKKNDNKKFTKNSSENRRKSSRKGRSVDCDTKTSGNNSTMRTFNDVSWYAKNPQILKDAGSLSFNNPLGATIQMEDVVPINSTFTPNSATSHLPGIFSISFIPTAGKSTDNSSALNMAARNIYSFVRHANSGHANYDSPDLMLYLLAMDNIYMLFNHGKRLYGIARYYSQYNRYLPEGLIEAMHFDKDDVINHLADLRYGLNVIAAKLNALCVPNTMTLFTRHSWMVSNVYRDADEAKAQNYLWVPSGYFVFNETGSPRGGFLQCKTFETYTVETFLSALNEALAAIIESEDMNIMSGDILKAYGVGKLWTLGAIGEEYAIEPVYNEEVLNQMHNTTCFWYQYSPNTAVDCNITQNPDNGALIYDPLLDAYGAKGNATQAHIGFPIVVNMPRGDVSPEQVIVGTRNTVQVAIDPDAAVANLKFDSLPSELITHFTIYSKEQNGSLSVFNFNSVFTSLEGISNFDPLKMVNIAQISHFDWHPILYLIEGENHTFLGYVGDMSNYTLVSANTLKKLHDTAILSELDVPVNGTI